MASDQLGQFVKKVVEHYYTNWSSKNWNNVGGLYADQCQAVYGDKQPKISGAQAICEKMNSFGTMAFDIPNLTIDTLDFQGQFYLVQIVGKLQIEGQDNALNFSQTWNLIIQQGDGESPQPSILLDIFKPVY